MCGGVLAVCRGSGRGAGRGLRWVGVIVLVRRSLPTKKMQVLSKESPPASDAKARAILAR